MKIGRNDPCPCGSGKKYKNCCLKINQNPELLWKKNFNKLCDVEVEKDKVSQIFYKTYQFVKETKWLGACHIISAIQYILLNEIGIKSELCIGVVFGADMVFDHSWIKLNDKVYDISLVNSLEGKISNPIIAGCDIFTLRKIDFKYGINRRLDSPAKDINELTLKEYFDGASSNIGNYTPKPLRKGVWNLIVEIGESIGINLNAEELSDKYSRTKRVLINEK